MNTEYLKKLQLLYELYHIYMAFGIMCCLYKTNITLPGKRQQIGVTIQSDKIRGA